MKILPLYPYPGGKSRLIKKYPALPSNITKYVLPFFGAGALWIHINKMIPNILCHINDISPIILVYDQIKNNYLLFTSYVERYALSVKDKESYYALRSEYYNTPPDKLNDSSTIAKILVLQACSFSGKVNPIKKFGTTYIRNNAGRVDNGKYLIAKIDNIRDILANTYIYNIDFLLLIYNIDIDLNTFVFLDPPYIGTANYLNLERLEKRIVRVFNYLDAKGATVWLSLNLSNIDYYPVKNKIISTYELHHVLRRIKNMEKHKVQLVLIRNK